MLFLLSPSQRASLAQQLPHFPTRQVAWYTPITQKIHTWTAWAGAEGDRAYAGRHLIEGVDILVLALVAIYAVNFIFRDTHFKGASWSGVVRSLLDGEGHDAFGPIPEEDPHANEDKDFVKKMKEGGRRLAIFYGSQSGTAESLAIRMAKEAKKRYGIQALVLDPDNVDISKLDQLPDDSIVIFVQATYGEGDPTDNAKPMWDFLAEENVTFSKGGNNLKGIRYVVFGLGNRTYEHFCEGGKKIDRRLAELKAERIHEMGIADDNGNTEEDFLAWKDGAWEAIAKQLDVKEQTGHVEPSYQVRETDEVAHYKVYHGELSEHNMRLARAKSSGRKTRSKEAFGPRNPFPARLVACRELFDTPERNAVHAEFDITGSDLTFEHGDHVAIWPINPEEEVQRAIGVFNIHRKKNNVFHAEAADDLAPRKEPFPVPTTYETALRSYLDIGTLAAREMLSQCADYAPSDDAKAKIEKITASKDEHDKEIAARGLNLAEALEFVGGKGSHWNVPFEVVIDAYPRLQPRYYSISSSPLLDKNIISVTATVHKKPVETEGGPKDHILGIATNYLHNLRHEFQGMARDRNAPLYSIRGPRNYYVDGNDPLVPLHTRTSQFKLPRDTRAPVVMIGPGTGVAPFRSFIRERVAIAQRLVGEGEDEAVASWGQMVLFYGCRRQKEDWMYRDEWPEYQRQLPDKLQVYTAHSRENKDKREYVQDKIREESELIVDLLGRQKGYLYLCGDATNMARQVNELLAEILGKGLNTDGKAYLKLMRRRGRFSEDVWS